MLEQNTTLHTNNAYFSYIFTEDSINSSIYLWWCVTVLRNSHICGVRQDFTRCDCPSANEATLKSMGDLVNGIL